MQTPSGSAVSQADRLPVRPDMGDPTSSSLYRTPPPPHHRVFHQVVQTPHDRALTQVRYVRLKQLKLRQETAEQNPPPPPPPPPARGARPLPHHSPPPL